MADTSMNTRQLNRADRFRIAELIDKRPGTCWANLATWAAWGGEYDVHECESNHHLYCTGENNEDCGCGKYRGQEPVEVSR